MTHDGARLIKIPMAWWHQAANDGHYGPLRGSISTRRPALEWIPVLVCVGLIVACILPLIFMKE